MSAAEPGAPVVRRAVVADEPALRSVDARTWGPLVTSGPAARAG